MSFKTGLLNLDYWYTCPTLPHSNTNLVLPRLLFKVCNLLRLFFGNSRFLYLLFRFQDIHGRGCGVHDFILSHGLSYLPAVVFFFWGFFDTTTSINILYTWRLSWEDSWPTHGEILLSDLKLSQQYQRHTSMTWGGERRPLNSTWPVGLSCCGNDLVQTKRGQDFAMSEGNSRTIMTRLLYALVLLYPLFVGTRGTKKGGRKWRHNNASIGNVSRCVFFLSIHRRKIRRKVLMSRVDGFHIIKVRGGQA